VFALSLALTGGGSVASVVSIVSFAACDSGEWSFTIPPGDAGAPDANEAACAAWARAYCAFQASCPAYNIPWEPGQCVPRLTLECELIASDPEVAFDPARAASCPEPEAGDCARSGGDLCVGPGRAAIGAPCLSGDACQSGACEFTYGPEGQPAACGVCVRQPCGGGCPAGQLCNVQVDGGEGCVTVASVGQPCKAPSDCASFFCTPDGKCGAAVPVGAVCSQEPAGPPCGDPATFCDATGHCRAYLYADYGAPCAPSGNDVYECTGLGACDLTDNQCIPPAADGEFCDDSQGLNCVYPALCTSHQCTFPSPVSCAVE
jgi:hypothetical protein